MSQAVRELLRDDAIPNVSFRDLGEHWLKDLGEPERLYQITAPGLVVDDYARAQIEGGPIFTVQDRLGRPVRDLVAAPDERLRLVIRLHNPGVQGTDAIARNVRVQLLRPYPTNDTQTLSAVVSWSNGFRPVVSRPVAVRLPPGHGLTYQSGSAVLRRGDAPATLVGDELVKEGAVVGDIKGTLEGVGRLEFIMLVDDGSGLTR